jgi:hypothetical protein
MPNYPEFDRELTQDIYDVIAETSDCSDLVLDSGRFNKKAVKSRPIMANTSSPLETPKEDIDLLRQAVCFERIDENIFVVLIAIDKDPKKNLIQPIKAHGDSLGGYAYSPKTDIVLVECCDYVSLGIVPVAFRISVPGFVGKQLMPLPDSLIYKYTSASQKKSIRLFCDKYRTCDIQYIQSVSRS